MAKRLLSTRLFAVEQREYPCAGKPTIVRDVIVHPGAVVLLPILDDGSVVMIRNYRHVVEETLWELPAGTREDGELAIDTARRELIEETGYRAGSVEPLIDFFSSPGVMTERMQAFIATDLTLVGQQLEEGEEIEVEMRPMAEVHRMVLAGEIRDGKTLAVLGFYTAQHRRDED